MSESKSKPLANNGFDWRKRNSSPTLEGEQKRGSPKPPTPVNRAHYTHRDPSMKPRKRITQAFAHHRLCERLF